MVYVESAKEGLRDLKEYRTLLGALILIRLEPSFEAILEYSEARNPPDNNIQGL